MIAAGEPIVEPSIAPIIIREITPAVQRLLAIRDAMIEAEQDAKKPEGSK